MDERYGDTFERTLQPVDKGDRKPVESPFRPTVVLVQAKSQPILVNLEIDLLRNQGSQLLV